MDIGTIVIIVVLLIAPVFICLSGAVAAAALGALINNEADAVHEGSELQDIWG